jgi:hypothetical protein
MSPCELLVLPSAQGFGHTARAVRTSFVPHARMASTICSSVPAVVNGPATNGASLRSKNRRWTKAHWSVERETMMTLDKNSNAETQPQARTYRAKRWRRMAGPLATVALALTMVAVCAAPASAGVRIVLGLGLPLYPVVPAYPPVAAGYPYGHSYAYPYPPPPAPYGTYRTHGLVAPPVVVPRVWVGGYWGWGHDHWGHRHRVWVRGHRH